MFKVPVNFFYFFVLNFRFYCAAAVDNRTRLDFHGERRIWDGHFIKKKIKGNSALYIFAEEVKNIAHNSIFLEKCCHRDSVY